MAEYTAAMFLGAGRGPGRANGALIAALRAGESFDMVAAAMGEKGRGRNGKKGKRNTTIERAREEKTTRSFLNNLADMKTEEEVTVKHCRGCAEALAGTRGRRPSVSRSESVGLCDP